MIHSACGVRIADVGLAEIGWRGDLVVPWLGFDASLSPALGARTMGNLALGSAYAGFCPGIGLYVRCTPAIDVGISNQPVIYFIKLGGAFRSLLTCSLRERAHHRGEDEQEVGDNETSEH
jgi:hypothetical protein